MAAEPVASLAELDAVVELEDAVFVLLSIVVDAQCVNVLFACARWSFCIVSLVNVLQGKPFSLVWLG